MSPHACNRLLSLTILVVLVLFAGCSDDDPAQPNNPTTRSIVAPLENAITDVPLLAYQPTNVTFTLQLPPDIPSVTAAEIDIAGTLDHVQIDGIPLAAMIARKIAWLLGGEEDHNATAYIRIGSDPESVCEEGPLYGPFAINHGTSLEASPATVMADEGALQIINTGSMTVCLTITTNFDCDLSVDGVAMDLTPGNCAAPANFAGTWSGTYQCGNWCGEPFGGPVELVVTQDGSEASYTDQGGDTFEGRVCGNTFRYEYVGEGFTERGTMTLNSNGTATKRSTWRGIEAPYCGGDCSDTLTRAGGGDCPPLLITSGSPPDGAVGVAYHFQVTTSGGQGTVTRWVIPTEPIPGLEGLENGVLAGTPTAEAVGNWEVQVTAYDACAGEKQVVQQTYTITISN